MNRSSQAAIRPIFVLMLVAALTTSVADAQTKVNPGFNMFSPEQDVEIGQQSAAEVDRQMPILNDSQVQAYVNRIGERLAKNAGGPNFPYTFKVVNASDINAFALPGGPVYINRGVIDQARNEGEVAGVMAHEIAHVALRHGTHQASKASATQTGLSILGGILGGKIGASTAQVLNVVGGVGLNVLFLRFSRDLESQADIRGAQILAASGYSPVDMVNFFHTLESVDKSKKTNFLSDHPAPPDRISRIEKEAKLLGMTSNPTTNVAELNRVQSSLRSRYGNAPTMEQIARSGPAAGGTSSPSRTRPSSGSSAIPRVEAPARTLSSYTSPSGVYRLSYPSNWRVYQEGSTGVTLAPAGGVGEVGGRQEIVYGAIVNHYNPFGSQQSRSRFNGNGGSVYNGNISLDQATQDLIGQVQASSPHLSVIRGSTQRFTISGGNALAVSLRGVNPNTGINERLTAVSRQLGDDHLIYILFITPEADAKAYGPLLQAMVNSLQVDPEHRH
ncbi:MAG: M48 family metallopeptidase [Acidobacteriota bacterium]